MRKKRTKFLGLFLTLAMLLSLFSTGAFAAETNASSDNLLINSGFTNGFENWVYTSGTSLETADSYSGKQPAKISIAPDATHKTPSLRNRYPHYQISVL